jgi:hypothetical protein
MNVGVWAAAGMVAMVAVLSSPSIAPAQNTPRYEVDSAWPKPLPHRWVLGGLGGLCVDANNHILILKRQDVIDGDLNGGTLAPPMIELDPDGQVVHSWGDLTLIDPRLHSCHFEKGSVWIASAPSGMVQKYTRDGRQLLLQIGTQGTLDSSDGTAKGTPLNSPAAVFFMPSSIHVDRTNGDVFVSDGEGPGTNRRIAVMDSMGTFLPHWIIDDMETVHCMTIANDGMVYVCNRLGSEIRVYDKKGKLQRSIAVPWTPMTPGKNLGSFGRPGSFPGQFNQVHGIAVDSKGNVYLAENRGRRVHKFRMVTQ